MLDIRWIRERPEELKKNILDRGLDPQKFDADKLLELDRQRTESARKIETLRAERNRLAEESGGGGLKAEGGSEIRERGKRLKEELKKLEEESRGVEREFRELMDWMPNITHPAMPVGKDASGNLETKSRGEKPNFDFTPRDHLELGEKLDLIDIKRAAKVSGSRFYYLKNEAVLMEWGIFDLTLKKLLKRKFIPILPPVLLRKRPLYGTGYFPAEATQIYEVATAGKTEEEEPLYLAGTSEQAMVAYHADEIFSEEELPKKYAGLSTCFRSEAGSWGKDVRGIKRVHQFDKVEMIYFTTPESSQKYMQEALEIEEEILRELGLPYRVIEMCSGDVGLATYRKFDLEVWLPSEERYFETHSNSDLASYHARRLNIKFRKKDGVTDFVHTISATGITNARTILAILENYQQADGSVAVPKVLQKYVGKEVIRRP